MSSQVDENQGFVLGVLFGVIALVITLVIGLTIHQFHKRHATKPVTALTVAGTANATSVVLENAAAKP
jgi:EamA domain-containing membrane protein RarD